MPQRRRTSPTARIASALAALVVALLVVTGVGTSLTPPYGDLAPWSAASADDVRDTPAPVGWTTDLAREMLPGVPLRCTGFSAAASSGSLVVVTGQPPPLGSSSGCSVTSIGQVRSTVALLDTATGVVRWSTDLATAFPSSGGSVAVGSSTVSTASGRALVEVTAGTRILVASLDLTTGKVRSSLDLAASNVGVQSSFEGGLALFGGSSSREGSTLWTLVADDDVAHPLWTGLLADQNSPLLTSSAVYAISNGRSVRIDGETGRLQTFHGGGVDLDSASPGTGAFYTSTFVDLQPVITAWTDGGRMLWTRSGYGSLMGSSRDCVLVSLSGTTKLTCLDSATGLSRWSRDVGTASRAGGNLGQTDADVYVYRSFGERTDVVVLDGATGRQKFTLDLAPLTYLDASSRTMGYEVTYTTSGTATAIAGYDTQSGATLWTLLSSNGGDTELWGGHLVHLAADGTATQLTNPKPLVLRG